MLIDSPITFIRPYIFAEAESRRPEMLARFRSEAHNELGAAGAPALAAKTEQRRERWVTDRLVQAGRSRAASVGWPDAYAYTKALGEQALMESKGAVPVSIVRPSIIESALAEPRPGWIRGFRMAEPVIVSFARGLLKEFPGVPEGTVDVIPVDLVVAAIIGVAAPRARRSRRRSRRSRRARSTPSSTGSWSTTRPAWFREHPLYDAEGQPIVVPDWSFPGRGRVQGQLNRAKNVLTRTEKLLHSLPLRGQQAEWSARLEEKRIEVERALEYVELYGLYAECEAIYGVDHLLALRGHAGPGGPGGLRLRPPRHRLAPLHHRGPPPVGDRARPRQDHAGQDEGPTGPSDCAATCCRRTATSPRSTSRTPSSPATSSRATRGWPPGGSIGGERVRYALRTTAEVPGLLALDRKDRGDFLRFFYRRYEDAPVGAARCRRGRAAVRARS